MENPSRARFAREARERSLAAAMRRAAELLQQEAEAMESDSATSTRKRSE